jgi:hypothetical protein
LFLLFVLLAGAGLTLAAQAPAQAFTIYQSVCVESEADTSPSCQPAPLFLIEDARLIAPEPTHVRAVLRSQRNLLDSQTTYPVPQHRLRQAELSPDDKDLADDGQPNDNAMELAGTKLWFFAADWRMSRPDPQSVSCFISSKNRPPP